MKQNLPIVLTIKTVMNVDERVISLYVNHMKTDENKISLYNLMTVNQQYYR